MKLRREREFVPAAEEEYKQREAEAEANDEKNRKIIKKDLQYVGAQSKVVLGADPRACCHLLFHQGDYSEATRAFFKTRSGIEGYLCLWQSDLPEYPSASVGDAIRPVLEKFDFPRNFKIYKSEIDLVDVFDKDFYKEYIYSVINI